MRDAPADPYGHCEALVRAQDRTAWLASLFAPSALRPYLHTLDAFRIEIGHVKGRVTQPLAGEIRLQWWSDAIAGEARGDALSTPVASALLDTIERNALPRHLLETAIEAHRVALYGEPMPSVEALERHCDATAGGFLRLAGSILAGPAGAVAAPAAHAGAALGVTRLLLAFPADAAEGAATLPADIMRRHGAGQENISSAAATAAVTAALAELRSLARTHLSSLRQMHSLVPEAATPAYLHVALIEPTLRLLARTVADPFAPSPVLPQWCVQWILWRASRGRGIPV